MSEHYAQALSRLESTVSLRNYVCKTHGPFPSRVRDYDSTSGFAVGRCPGCLALARTAPCAWCDNGRKAPCDVCSRGEATEA